MSNSSLVDYTKLSPNYSAGRNHAIDTITIHCMAGNLTIETCGNVFAPTSRQASSQYGVGSDGRIGMYCEEKNRSWCSSSASNDNRAITIEVANDGGADTGWHVSDKAMASLIKLCADICKRNNIKQLKWSESKTDRVNHSNGCNMTVHRDFASKDCPGLYLMSKMSYIASETNKLLNTNVISYQAHCQTYGWLPVVTDLDNDYAGTTGKSKRMEAVKIWSDKDLAIRYRAHCQTYGWQEWVNNGEIAGTVGEAKRMEAIIIEANIPIKYRVHMQGIGWGAWVTNGQVAGTTGEARRLEAIEIKKA